ncbi:hypothetical protein FHT28_006182 [Rhizobium sp. SG570]|nr:hypothetical protein [Rhizobium sp. SG570]
MRGHDRLDGGRLHRLDADDRFDQHLLAIGTAFELLVDAVLQERPDQNADRDIDRDRGNDDPGKLRR